MTHPAIPHRRLAGVAATTLAAALLGACGGGGGDAGGDGFTQQNAQGYAADAVTMPVTAASGIDAATGALEAGLAGAASAAAPVRPLAATPQDLSGSATCANGGSVAWTVSGGTATTQGNGQLDAGETYAVTFTACATDDGPVLDGGLTLAVNDRTASSLDLTHTASALQLTTPTGQFTLGGSWRHQRSRLATEAGGTQLTSHLTSSGVTLASVIGARQASYTLNALDWTVVRSFDASGALVSRSHQGSLSLAANTPRRPAATLQVTTQGVLTLGSDGLAAQGSFTVVTSRNTIACTYGDGTALLTLDLGSDGTIDRTWTLTRTDFDGGAG